MVGHIPLNHPALAEVEAYLREAKIQPSTLGKLAVGDSSVVERLAQGRVTFRVAERLREWMRAHPPGKAA